MSVAQMAMVWEREIPPKKSSWQQVLLVLADHAHDDGTKSFPGVERIAWKTGISERQVKRILKELEAVGCIVCVAGAEGGRGYAKEYHMKLHVLPKKPDFVPGRKAPKKKGDNMTPFNQNAEKGDICDIKGDIAMSEKGDTVMSPQPSLTSNNHHDHPSHTLPSKEGLSVHELIDGYVPEDALVKDMARQGVGSAEFIMWAVERWRAVAKASGQRIKSAASHFKRWLTGHKDLKGLRDEWWRETHQQRPQAARQAVVTPDAVFASDAGQYALRQGVGSGFLSACQQAKEILGEADVDRLLDERAAAVVDQDDKAAAMVARATEGREKALADKFLKDDAA